MDLVPTEEGMGYKKTDKDVKQPLPQVDPSLGTGPTTMDTEEKLINSFKVCQAPTLCQVLCQELGI